MSTQRQADDLDRIISAWFEADADVRESDELIPSIFARTQRTRPRPAWLLPERWIPMQLSTPMRRVPSVAPVLVLIALLLAVAIAIAYVGTRPRVPPPFGPAANGRMAYDSGGQIWTADADGQNARQITFGATSAFSPIFSRDGTKIAYRRQIAEVPQTDPGYGMEMVVADADGGNPVIIGKSAKAMTNASWAPDSQFIAYTRVKSSPSDIDRVFISAADGSSTTDLGDMGGDAWGPTWAPDGRYLAVGIADGTLAVVDRDGSNAPRKLNAGTYQEIGQKGEIAEWSPDGTSILFSAGVPEVSSQTYIVGLDGRPERPFAPSAFRQEDAVWSPDGSMVAFLRDDPLGPVVVIADATGREIRTLDEHVDWNEPVWSPDGTKIMTAIAKPGQKEPTYVVILDAAGVAPPTKLTLPPIDLEQLAPDFAGSWQRLAQ